MRLRCGPRGVQLSAGPHNTEFERTAPSLRKINEPDGSVGGFGNAFAVPPLNSTSAGPLHVSPDATGELNDRGPVEL